MEFPADQPTRELMSNSSQSVGAAESRHAVLERSTLHTSLLLVGCFACAVLDGFDVVVVSYVVPELARFWSAPLSSFGWVLSAGLAGLVFGSLVLAPLANRYGRRITMLSAVFGAALATLANAFVTNIPELILCRFFVGTAMGVITALVITIAFEAVPLRYRVVVVTVVGCGMSLGNLASGLLASFVIPHYGWAILFSGASVFSVFVGSLFLLYLHDSPAVIGKSAGGYLSSIKSLVDGDLAGLTAILWLLNFGGVGANYVLLSWLPSLLAKSGYDMSRAALATSLISVGGLIGGPVSGFLLARFGKRWLLANYVAAFLLIALLPLFFHSQMLYVVDFVIGICIVGGYICNNVVISQAYPVHLRAGGLGWAQGVGRTGSIATPLLISFALQLNAPLEAILLIAAVFPVLSALAIILLMIRSTRGSIQAQDAQP